MVTSTWRKFVCWRSSAENEGENSSRGGGDIGSRVDGLWWYKDSGQHVNGEFSMAVIQANNILEDYSQLESGPMSLSESAPHGTFVGIYDGHAGPEASRFISDHLFENIKTLHDAELAADKQEMSADVIKNAYLATEEEFLSLVKKQWEFKPQIASVGSCCLVGIICSGLLYVANAGDSRVVLGRLEKVENEVKAMQLSTEHNASFESVREELHALHPNDPQIVVLKHRVWRVKGLIQVSRSIGDAYLKKQEFNRVPLLPKFRLPEPFEKPILLAEPSILVQKLYPEDQFLIFASDGLWEHLSNQEAVDLVNSSPRNGIARKLVKAALQEAAKKREMRYSDLKKIDRGVRRHFHDDITVIVLFLDSHLISRSSSHGPILSVKGGGNTR
ncbi:probable protein phosphatase 2C 38 isoform X1 [Primulina huaijiensis]|uniref:probable protein phosphatase 2C 38 isoform X1 n=1 Tax=Primulina huaijiensis TaxID=1492673 RepID=UPI003CC73137